MAELRNYDISMIPQSYGLISHQSVYNNVSLPLFLNKTVRRHDIERITLSCLEEVGLADKSKKKVCELSGGEQQWVVIAGAIVCRPKLILADEPTGALDQANTERVMELLKNLNRNHKITIMIATHDPLAFNNCRDMIRLENGHII